MNESLDLHEADALFELGLAEANTERSPRNPNISWLTVIALLGLLMAVAIPKFRPTHETGCIASCIAHLKQLDSAKEQWAMDNKKPAGTQVQFSDLVGATLYMKSVPTCPQGGEYNVNDIGTNPTCTHEGHRLP